MRFKKLTTYLSSQNNLLIGQSQDTAKGVDHYRATNGQMPNILNCNIGQQ